MHFLKPGKPGVGERPKIRSEPEKILPHFNEASLIITPSLPPAGVRITGLIGF